MNYSTPNFSEDTLRRRRNALIATGLYLFASVIVSIYLLLQLSKDPSWQIRVATVTMLAMSMAWVVSLYMIWRGRIEAGVWLTVAASLLGAVGVIAAISGLGMIFLIGSVFLCAIVAIETLQTRQPAMIVTGVAAGLLFILMDAFLPWERISVAGIQSLITFIVPVPIMLLGFVIFRQFRNYSLRVKLISSIISATVASIVIFSIVSNSITATLINAQVERAINALAEASARDAANVIESNLDALNELALNKFIQESVSHENPAQPPDSDKFQSLDARWERALDSDPLIQNVIADDLSAEFRNFQSIFPQFVEVFVTDQYGGIISSSDRTSDYYQADEGWWQAAWNDGKGGVYIGEPTFDESSNTVSIQMAIPVASRNIPGKLIGVLCATIDINELAALVSANQFGETGKVGIIFQNNQILEHGETTLGTVDAQTASILDAFSGEHAQVEYEGAPSLVSKRPVVAPPSPHKEHIDQLGWFVVAHQDLEEAQLPITTTKNANMVVSIIIVIVMTAVAMGIAQFISNPLARLTAAAERAATGDLSTQTVIDSEDEIGILSAAFNTMTSQLKSTLGELEQRVAARTKDLAIVAEVSAATSSILEPQRLLQEVVDLTKERFHLYHSHIYLLDDEGKNLMLVAGAGEPGRIMATEKRSIPLDREQSLVARAAREQQGVTVNDVTLAPDFFPNPLLPDTRSELAAPMIVGNKLIGVFDIQSDQVGRFTDSDVNIQTTLAAQLATSIQNARSFEQSKKQAEFEAQVNLIGSRIQSASSIEETLQTAIRELGKAAGVSRVSVSLAKRLEAGNNHDGRNQS